MVTSSLDPTCIASFSMTLPTGSRSPALFQTLSLVADPIAFFDRYSAKYGDTFTARVLGPASPPVVFLGRPEAIQAGVYDVSRCL
jgi:cytochrome P450 family 110